MKFHWIWTNVWSVVFVEMSELIPNFNHILTEAKKPTPNCNLFPSVFGQKFHYFQLFVGLFSCWIFLANSFGQEFVVCFTYALFHFSECWFFTCWCAKCILVVVNKLLILLYWLGFFLLIHMFSSQAEAFNVERPCSPPETGGTLQWGCSNCRDYDR